MCALDYNFDDTEMNNIALKIIKKMSVKQLLIKDKFNSNTICYATKYGSLAIVKYLLEKIGEKYILEQHYKIEMNLDFRGLLAIISKKKKF